MKEERKEYAKAWYEAHREERKAASKAYYQAHKDKVKARMKAWQASHKEHYRAYQRDYMKAYRQEHKDKVKAYMKSDMNSLGQTKHSIRMKSQHYLKKYGTKIPGYQIHHCCTYDDPYKFIYCSIEMHRLIHAYLRAHNIDADSDHYEQIKHLLDDTTFKYNIE